MSSTKTPPLLPPDDNNNNNNVVLEPVKNRMGTKKNNSNSNNNVVLEPLKKPMGNNKISNSKRSKHNEPTYENWRGNMPFTQSWANNANIKHIKSGAKSNTSNYGTVDITETFGKHSKHKQSSASNNSKRKNNVTYATVQHKNGTNSNKVFYEKKERKRLSAKIAEHEKELKRLQDEEAKLNAQLAQIIKLHDKTYSASIAKSAEDFEKVLTKGDFKGFRLTKPKAQDTISTFKYIFTAPNQIPDVVKIMEQSPLTKDNTLKIVDLLIRSVGLNDSDGIKQKLTKVVVALYESQGFDKKDKLEQDIARVRSHQGDQETNIKKAQKELHNESNA